MARTDTEMSPAETQRDPDQFNPTATTPPARPDQPTGDQPPADTAGEVPPEAPPPPPATPEGTQSAPAVPWAIAPDQELASDGLGLDLHFFIKDGNPHLRIVKQGQDHMVFHGVFNREGTFIGEDVDG